MKDPVKLPVTGKAEYLVQNSKKEAESVMKTDGIYVDLQITEPQVSGAQFEKQKMLFLSEELILKFPGQYQEQILVTVFICLVFLIFP